MAILGSFRTRMIQIAWAALALSLIPLHDTRPGGTQAVYDHARQLFLHGKLAQSQLEAEQGYRQFRVLNVEWASKFQLLEAEDMVSRGIYKDALEVLAAYHPSSGYPEGTVRKLAIEADALTRQHEFSAADQRLTQAEGLCKNAAYASCGYVLRGRGTLAALQGRVDLAWQYYRNALIFAQTHHDLYLQTSASANLGFDALQMNRFDEAADWSRTAYRTAVEIGAENLAQAASGNLGWAYYQLGDDERALDQFLQAEEGATRIGSLRGELKWISDAGYVYRDTGDLTRSTDSYRRALALAKQIDSKEDIVNALEDLAQVSVASGKLDEASAYLDQVVPMELAGGNRLSANLMLTQGMLAAARRQDEQAESLFREVWSGAKNQTTTRLGAGEELAGLFELQGKPRAAEQMYKATLAEFDAARAQLKSDESRLPFVFIAAHIYDNYVHLLVQQGRGDEALALADRSRARTLEESLGVTDSRHASGATAIDPRRIAKKTGATLLFYWLGARQSYLWAITPDRIALFPLPAQREIAARVERYGKALLDLEDPLQAGNDDGQQLYKLLVAPAARMIRPAAPVVILPDGALNHLNFETLLAPGPSPETGLGRTPAPGPDPRPMPGRIASPAVHYWIDDATLLSAPSLAMLAAAKSPRPSHRKLLLLGNPVTASEDYPSLPLFGLEMNEIQKHFQPADVAVFSGPRASPAAYLNSNPAQYSYIHFVSHAVASRTDPLDSAIILSSSSAGDSSFKLYARDIMQHPIDARLVTVSACYTSGTRAYAGEGLVGLSWAFLRAGADSVIGALWEVSDESSPRLMDTLYQGIEDGETPAVALRRAKLSLIHSSSSFNRPFYWAPFQIYTR